MLISPADAGVFFELYPSLIGFAAGRLGGVAGIVDVQTFRSTLNEARAEARDCLFDNVSLVDDFIQLKAVILNIHYCQ
ncbi:MAG: hypothetical protein ACYTF1_09490 [Planctomycetota bacterium]|jgi:hypothetical protein